MDEHATILDEIRTLLDAPSDSERQPTLARIEHTLTAGYAQALALDSSKGALVSVRNQAELSNSRR